MLVLYPAPFTLNEIIKNFELKNKFHSVLNSTATISHKVAVKV
jgi:hypothetical protein